MPSNSTPMVFFRDNVLSDKKKKIILLNMSKETNKTNEEYTKTKIIKQNT